MRRAPAGAAEWSSRDFRSPGRGSDSMFATNPPRRANLQCPSGTIRIISSNKPRDATSSRRFEVEDFAKQIPGWKSVLRRPWAGLTVLPGHFVHFLPGFAHLFACLVDGRIRGPDVVPDRFEPFWDGQG